MGKKKEKKKKARLRRGCRSRERTAVGRDGPGIFRLMQVRNGLGVRRESVAVTKVTKVTRESRRDQQREGNPSRLDE